MFRKVEAATIPLTDVVGLQTKKARALIAGEHQATRAVVTVWDKATGVSADYTRAGLFFNASGLADTSKRTGLLSLCWPGKSRYGAGNERHFSRNSSPHYLRTH
jgi:hypothetical protein